MGPSPSLLRRLLFALLPSLVLLAALGAALDYLQVRQLADEAYDEALGNTAFGLAASLESDRDNDAQIHLAALAGAVAGQHIGSTLRFVVLSEGGLLIAGDPALAALAEPSATGKPVFRDAKVGDRNLRIATYRHVGPVARVLVVVAEGLEARRLVAQRAVRTTIWANAMMIAAVLAVVTTGVRLALAPLRALGLRASQHETGTSLALPADGVPREVRPLVDGINRLIERLRRSTDAQQAFLNNSAHQLRTPLAGMQAQLDVLVDSTCDTRVRAELLALSGSVRRLTRVTQQMLALARTDAKVQALSLAQPAASVDLPELLQGLIVQHLDAADTGGIDLGIDATPVQVTGESWMLREMLANLIDNALRYAPVGSEVTLRCGTLVDASGPRTYAEVEDAGPGIPATQRERVFDRFVRLSEDDGQGSGLGMAIVREVARAHRAEVQLLDGQKGRGTRVRVLFEQEPLDSLIV